MGFGNGRILKISSSKKLNGTLGESGSRFIWEWSKFGGAGAKFKFLKLRFEGIQAMSGKFLLKSGKIFKTSSFGQF